MASRSQPECAATPATAGAEPSAAFTPGPWHIEGRRGAGYIISAGINAEGDGPADYVGVLDPMFHVSGEPSALAANARLIAAAPDLVLTLAEIAAKADLAAAACDDEGRATGFRILAADARAAIAKAPGTSEAQS